jgi:hypothetical protein
MGRSFASIRQGVKGISEHWARVPHALRPEDRAPAEHLVTITKRHSSAAFFGCDDPLEAAVFSSLVEIARHHEKITRDGEEAPRVGP